MSVAVQFAPAEPQGATLPPAHHQSYGNVKLAPQQSLRLMLFSAQQQSRPASQVGSWTCRDVAIEMLAAHSVLTGFSQPLSRDVSTGPGSVIISADATIAGASCFCCEPLEYEGSTAGPYAIWIDEDRAEGAGTSRRSWTDDPIAVELEALRLLKKGWDGEDAAAPSPVAINQAQVFIREAGALARCLEPTLHVDGSVILGIGDGSEGSLRFKGDGWIVHAIRGQEPGIIELDLAAFPKVVAALPFAS